VHVTIEGTGSGKVSSAEGYFGGGEWSGSPPIECTTPVPGEGTCETELESTPKNPEAKRSRSKPRRNPAPNSPAGRSKKAKLRRLRIELVEH
jgi:hypothetical protein